jgi:predicted nucleotidyltransferase
MSTGTQQIQLQSDELAAFCRRHHIQKLSLFGSVLRNDFRPDSDVDVLVEFEPGHVPGFAFITMQDELSVLLGRKVDLNTPNFLSRYFRDQVLSEAKVLYAKT